VRARFAIPFVSTIVRSQQPDEDRQERAARIEAASNPVDQIAGLPSVHALHAQTRDIVNFPQIFKEIYARTIQAKGATRSYRDAPA